ncbi:MAG TPA: DUF1156 domain-containing protein [Ktedonobacteraceae bacterium]|nr:DUF1156 domain-containing protein [Ktedonobacteraceae bacterium]
MQQPEPYRKKLIEVALPLDAISEASVREKSIRHGHPSTLHLWWSRKPLATCRAVLFASLVDDPSEHPEQFPTEAEQDAERQRLFGLMEELIKWENSNNQDVLGRARAEMQKSSGGQLPAFLDPFAGGGSIPLEAQRLGLEAHASDLNPVAVLIEKALIEIPPKFANRSPISQRGNQLFQSQKNDWKGAHGLAEDIRFYGKWMRDEAEKRIGHLYPKAKLPDGSEATVIAWLWVRTVTCPNPACGVQMPLTSKWWLSKKKGKETWAEPVIDHTTTPSTISFTVKSGQGKPQDGTVSKRGAICIACGTTIYLNHIRTEAQKGKMGVTPLAIVAEGHKSRIYLAPNSEHKSIAESAHPRWKPEELVTTPSHDVDRLPMYGMYIWGDAFTSRQLVALTTFSDLVQEVRQRVLADAAAADLPNDERPLHAGGCGAQAYADAVATYLAIAVDRLADRNSSICSWDVSRDSTRNTFARQAIPMIWDFAEANPMSDSTGNFYGTIDWVAEVIAEVPCDVNGAVKQRDATTSVNGVAHPMISTDPPYYDNIGYADLSDFFYVWLRRSLSNVYPDIFRTMLVPKKEELVATPYRFEGSKSKAQEFFETGLGHAFERMRAAQHPAFPLTVYYAFKQAEAEESEKGENGRAGAVVASTGWETMLEGLIRAGFTITGTWPMRTEMMNRSVGQGTNALASSIVLVCRPRPVEAPIASRREFLLALKRELPEKLRRLQHGGIAPVDLAQASIGPGMSIYSRYRQVVESDGTPLRVRTALQMINQELDAALAEQEGEYENETRWAIAWFEQFGMQEGAYGVAETLSKAKNMSVAHLEESGLVASKAGRVRLRRREELPESWTPRTSTVWELTQRLIYALLEGQGESGAATILRQALSLSESARDLSYRLYTVCERQGWAQEALAYNALITSWSQIIDLAHKEPSALQQPELL